MSESEAAGADNTESMTHDCFQNATWESTDEYEDPVVGECNVCENELEHYCDNSASANPDSLEFLEHGSEGEPIYRMTFACDYCHRTLEARFEKLGTWDPDTETKIYGP